MTDARRWTQTDITDLRQRLAAGTTENEIAAAVDRTVEAVEAMMSRLRLRGSGRGEDRSASSYH